MINNFLGEEVAYSTVGMHGGTMCAPSIDFDIHRFAYPREGKIHRNIPLGLWPSTKGKS